jgi:hypothetical protein
LALFRKYMLNQMLTQMTETNDAYSTHIWRN